MKSDGFNSWMLAPSAGEVREVLNGLGYPEQADLFTDEMWDRVTDELHKLKNVKQNALAKEELVRAVSEQELRRLAQIGGVR